MAQVGTLSSFNKWLAVTTSNTVNLDGSTYSAMATVPPVPCDSLWVSTTATTLTAVMANGIAVQFPVTAIGIIPIRAIRVNATGTTATGILALYQV